MINIMEKVVHQAMDKLMATPKKALGATLQPPSDLAWKPMAAGPGTRRKDGPWEPGPLPLREPLPPL